ncbi:hypothetical protein Tco_0802123 [Tanacetum coccineum]|uniref:Uncharacterized protein n=1 Tax=Tanacetum coccineum TaxID=301880 RepID=A0ABQ5A1Y4_9ASTR
MPNLLPTHPTLMLDSDFIPSDDSLGSDLEVSFPYGTRNKILIRGYSLKSNPRYFYLEIHFLSHLSDCPDYEDSRARDHFVEIPSGESKVHIEVLSVLWGNRLPILDGSLPLSRAYGQYQLIYDKLELVDLSSIEHLRYLFSWDKVTEEPRKEDGDSNNDQEKEDDNVNSTNNVNTASDGNNTNNVNVAQTLLLLRNVMLLGIKLLLAVESENGQWGTTITSPSNKIVVTEASVRRDLQLDDEGGETHLFPMTHGGSGLEEMGFVMKVRSAYCIQSLHPSLLNLHHLNLKGNKNLGGLRRRTLRVLDLENIKTAQAQEITSLKKRVKKLEKKGGSRTKILYRVGRSARVISFEEANLGDQEDTFKQGRKIDDIDKDAEITLLGEREESEIRLEEAKLKSARPKTKGVVIQNPSESTPTISLQLPSQVKGQGSKDKGKAKMIEPEKPLKKKD